MNTGNIIYQTLDGWGVVSGLAGSHAFVLWEDGKESYIKDGDTRVKIVLDLGRSPESVDIEWLTKHLFNQPYDRILADRLMLRVIRDSETDRLLEYIGHDGVTLEDVLRDFAVTGFASYAGASLRYLVQSGQVQQIVNSDGTMTFWAICERDV